MTILVNRKIPAELFQNAMKERGCFENRKDQKIVHVEALCEMMKALTGDTRFTDQVEELLKRQEEGEEIVMCEYIDILEVRGENRLATLI